MTARQIIRSNREKVGITSDRKLMETAGISYSTFTHERAKDEGSYTLREMREIIKITDMPLKDVLTWVFGKEISLREITKEIYGTEI